MAETLIKNFNQISKKDTEIAGGKGASLGEMTQAKIPVPEGFVILSNAFDRFLEETDLTIEIDAVLDSVDIKKVHTVENASKKIQAMLFSREMPENIKIEILKFYKNLDCKFVAVRSSTTSEDSVSAAWAGQLDSFLNTTKETLLENVKKCWASLFTPRAIFYRFEKRLDKDKISVAVVVQKMVDSEESGIAFSVHPVTQDENQIIIEAGFGLNEAIVSGSITPDSYVVDKQGYNILDINVNEQTKALYKKPKGGNEWKELGEKGGKQVLTKKEIIELSKLIVKIENHYGFPCDIEWTKEKGKFYIVQSRPITTITKKQELLDKPLAIKFLDEAKDQILLPPQHNSSILVQAAGWNVDAYFDRYYEDRTKFPVFVISKKEEGIMYYTFTKLVNIGKEFFLKYWNDESLIKSRFLLFDKLSKITNDIYNKLTYEFIEKNDVENLIKHIQESFDATINLNNSSAFSFYFDEKMYHSFIKELKINIRNSNLNLVWELGTNPPINSFEKIREIDALKLILREKEISKIAEKLQYFGATYGHIKELNLFEKEFKNNFKTYLRDPKKAKEIIKENKSEIDKRTKDFQEKLKYLNKEEKKLVKYLNDIIELRDKRKDVIAKMTLTYYKVLKKLFKKYKVQKKLIYFYRFGELLKGEDFFKKNINSLPKRKEGYCSLLHYNGKIEESYNFDENKKIMDEYFQSMVKKGMDITGQIAYKGKVKGKIKIIMNRNEFKNFQKGDILVTGMTRPEFVPLMKIASAIITNEGGITCHAAIISRELKLPCIIGTKNATLKLKDGDMVEVDANKGIVRILKKKK